MTTSELLEKQEELHPDLKDYVCESEHFMQLHHPLMIVIPYWETMNADINASYEQKLKDLRKWEEQGNWFRYLFVFQKPYRLTEFVYLENEYSTAYFSDQEFWKIAGWLWTDTDNHWQNVRPWITVLRSERDSKECFMNTEEQEFLKSLPDEVTIYRGCFKKINEEGLSWTLDESVAKKFSGYSRERENWTPIIKTQTVSKERIFAVKLGRQESEVVLKAEY